MCRPAWGLKCVNVVDSTTVAGFLRPSNSPPVHVYVRSSVHPFVRPSVYLSVCQSLRRSIVPFHHWRKDVSKHLYDCVDPRLNGFLHRTIEENEDARILRAYLIEIAWFAFRCPHGLLHLRPWKVKALRMKKKPA